MSHGVDPALRKYARTRGISCTSAGFIVQCRQHGAPVQVFRYGGTIAKSKRRARQSPQTREKAMTEQTAERPKRRRWKRLLMCFSLFVGLLIGYLATPLCIHLSIARGDVRWLVPVWNRINVLWTPVALYTRKGLPGSREYLALTLMCSDRERMSWAVAYETARLNMLGVRAREPWKTKALPPGTPAPRTRGSR